MSQQGRHVTQSDTFQNVSAREAVTFREAAAKLPPGTERELLLRRARQAETASRANAWVDSPGLKGPT
jgi:hypothetical protein